MCLHLYYHRNFNWVNWLSASQIFCSVYRHMHAFTHTNTKLDLLAIQSHSIWTFFHFTKVFISRYENISQQMYTSHEFIHLCLDSNITICWYLNVCVCVVLSFLSLSSASALPFYTEGWFIKLLSMCALDDPVYFFTACDKIITSKKFSKHQCNKIIWADNYVHLRQSAIIKHFSLCATHGITFKPVQTGIP